MEISAAKYFSRLPWVEAFASLRLFHEFCAFEASHIHSSNNFTCGFSRITAFVRRSSSSTFSALPFLTFAGPPLPLPLTRFFGAMTCLGN